MNIERSHMTIFFHLLDKQFENFKNSHFHFYDCKIRTWKENKFSILSEGCTIQRLSPRHILILLLQL